MSAAYDKLTQVVDADKDAFIAAVTEGLAQLGGVEGDWDSEAIEILLDPIVTYLLEQGIPSVGSSSQEAVDFWIEVAAGHDGDRD